VGVNRNGALCEHISWVQNPPQPPNLGSSWDPLTLLCLSVSSYKNGKLKVSKSSRVVRTTGDV
jgi:hypothetical protein